jgi:nucleoside-triphosphatase THEP1
MKIGICGKMCSGKSTLSTKIVEEFNDYNFKIDSFAGKIYKIAYDLFNMKEKDRILLQNIGSTMRDIDKDVWVKYILNKYNDTDNIIIDDVRYPNEVLSLRKKGYFLIKLVISHKVQEKRIKNLYKLTSNTHLNNRTHPSETSLDDIDNDAFDIIVDVDNKDVSDIIIQINNNIAIL